MNTETLTIRNRLTREQAADTHLYLPNGVHYPMTLANHNIDEVLPGSKRKTQEGVRSYYDQRGWHFPLKRDPQTGLPSTRLGLLVAESTADVEEQVAYLRRATKLPFEVVTPDTLPQGAFVAPYIRTSRAEARLRGMEAEVFGFHPELTDAIKNKADAHLLVQEYYQQGNNLNVADFTIANVNDSASRSLSFLEEIENIYKETGLSEDYKDKLGVVLRASESDGNYGNCIVRVKDGGIIIVKDGDVEHADRVEGQSKSSWKKAFTRAQAFLKTTMDEAVEDRVVISRFADIVDSPGMTVSIVDDHVLSWGWNGQLMMEGSSACIGTSNYEPKDDYCKNLQAEFEEQSAEDYAGFLRWLADKKDVDFSQIRANTQIDYMLPSELEFELQKRRGQKKHLIVAEFNPRDTEFTDSVKGRALFDASYSQTTNGLRKVIADGIHTYAKYSLPPNTDPRKVRWALETIGATDVFVRMAPTPSENPKDKSRTNPQIGITIYKDRKKGEEFMKRAIAVANSTHT